MNRVKRTLALLLALVMALSLAACGKGGSGDEWAITYWIARGEDASYYPEYEDNPIVQYIYKTKTFNGKPLKIDFITAPPGSEADDFSVLLGTGDYADVLDLSMAGSSAVELYEEEILWDLTELVPAHMPNLMKFLENEPLLKNDLYTYYNGEKKILTIRGFSDKQQENFQGFCYRRDWIVKYGTNPQTGAAFTGSYTDPSDKYSWTDDVVFPNGTDEPIYISDWEWMFDIFTKAMAAEGITDGYCYAPYYAGYQATGDLYTAFGGGAPFWYMDGDTVVDGTVNENMRAYLQCMNTWYKNGWIEKNFDENTGDMFFAVDTKSVYAGKVGLWQGRQSTTGVQLQGDDSLTKDILAYGCRQPINDIYGGPEQQNKTPNHMYQYARSNYTAGITKKLSEEEVIAFLEWVDFLYTEEGMLLANVGMTGEQYEKVPAEIYERLGFQGGAYEVREENGRKVYAPLADTGSYDFNAITLNRVNLRFTLIGDLDKGLDRYLKQSTEAWDYYESTANMPNMLTSAVSVDENKEITKIRSSLDQHLQRTVPAMIKGEAYDVWDDAQWADYVKSVNKYRSERITEIYQAAWNMVK